MTNEELFDAYRQVVSERDQLANAGDHLWGELANHGVVNDHMLLPRGPVTMVFDRDNAPHRPPENASPQRQL